MGATAMDKITFDILWNRLIAATNEQAAALMRSSFTSVVRDAGDLSAAVFDRRGRMVAQAVTGTPGHINSMATGMRYFLEKYPAAGLKPGDILITNDPWKTASQLHDITVVTPVFRSDRLIAFFGSCCHTLDIGGRGLSADAPSIYEEGILIPVTKLYEAGRPVEVLFDMMRSNVRTPEEMIGDLHSQIVGNRVGGEQLLDFLEEFGLEDIEALSDEITDRTEQAMRECIGQIPDGSYSFALDGDGFDDNLHLAASVTIEGDRMFIDYAGSSGASKLGINVCLNYTRAYTIYGLKCALSPEVPNNDGTFRAIEIVAPEGSILNAQHPSAVCGRHLVGHYLPSLIMGALAKAGVKRYMAPGYDGLWESHIVGNDEETGKLYAFTWFSSGGTGALANQDGFSATAYPSSVANVAAEVIETCTPMRVVSRSLRQDSGGAGTFRGGLGQVFELEIRTSQPISFAGIYERLETAAPGMDRGLAGATGRVTCDPEQKFEAKKANFLKGGTRIKLELPGGGGVGLPTERDPQRVLEDVSSGYVSLEAAREIYGVYIDPVAMTVDEDRTKSARNV